ncbi:MAG: hypothetical protein ACFFCX_04855 [Candidatus Sifarchaeia archaeon]
MGALINQYIYKVRLSSTGEARFIGSKKVLAIAMLGMAIVAFLESLNYWNWTLITPRPEPANLLLIWFVSMMIIIPIFIILTIDLSLQWYQLRG